VDLYALMDERFLGRLRYCKLILMHELFVRHTDIGNVPSVFIALSTGWEATEQDTAEVGALELLLHELDEENWVERRWHYEHVTLAKEDVTYESWINETAQGQEMRPRLKTLRNR
jgi:hypothetical protein